MPRGRRTFVGYDGKRAPREGQVFDEEMLRALIVDECPPGFVEVMPGVFVKPSPVDDERLN